MESRINPLVFFINFNSNIKIYHWMTTSYSRHAASDQLYDKLQELSDQLVEIYIGKYGRPKLTKKDIVSSVAVMNDITILTYLESCITYLRKDIYKFINEKDTEIINIIDEIIGEINQTKYRFTLV